MRKIRNRNGSKKLVLMDGKTRRQISEVLNAAASVLYEGHKDQNDTTIEMVELMGDLFEACDTLEERLNEERIS